MHPRASAATVILILLLCVSSAYAQKTTEQFIPVGKSPGISGKYSLMGQLEEVDRQNRVVVVTNAEGRHTIKVTDATNIWLDRTPQRRSCESATLNDLTLGLRIEIKYVDYETKEEADWIKLEIPAGSAGEAG